MRRLLLTSTSVFGLLFGCSSQPSDDYVDYQKRLANVVDVSFNPISYSGLVKLTPPSLPNEPTISLIELASINHCEVSRYVAEHNNQLGKVAVPSEKLKYAIRFIQLMPKCIESLDDKNELLKSTLADALIAKKQAVSTMFQLMLSSEREMQSLLVATSKEIPVLGIEGKEAAREGLTSLVTIKTKIDTQDFDSITPQDITLALKNLNQNSYVSALVSSSVKQANLNEQTTFSLNTIDIQKTLCKKGRAKNKAEILSNVFQTFYIAPIQPYQSQLVGSLEQISPLLFKLYEQTPSLAVKFAPTNEASLLAKLKDSAKQHVKWWQAFYKSCEINPFNSKAH
ncbi:DUF3080 domain-containing protein [Pseudoalteromonas xiamenensis]|uniref:DUF3080 family protein n=1 Tax=Pseudoalteromonas xiamenensis TaxID=882626 RepID=UPI0027E58075|nr:DUF3080 family protein [Pseudoalteromonas xiamenensis]WMN60017.1 DUF3080 domain-containing protein [Pseudoalteromonas xiamenensis]